MYSYYLIYKPFGMLSQFSKEGDHKTLADLEYTFEKDVYPVGRLDADSEGLLLLTNDGSLNQKLLHPDNSHFRTYLVQVDGDITADAVKQLERGVTINVNGKLYNTMPAKVQKAEEEPHLPERIPPIRFRKSIPTSWIYISLKEGKNRQVRKMTAQVGFPTLRLVRYAMCGLTIEDKSPGGVYEIMRNDIKF